MSETWRMDLIEGFRVTRKADKSIEIVRPCIVKGLTVAAGSTDPEVLLRVTESAGFPGFWSEYPTTIGDYKGALLRDARVISRTQRTNSARVDLIYTRFGTDWALELGGTINFIQKFSTADGTENMQVWYNWDPAQDPNNTPDPAKSDRKNAAVTAMIPSLTLKATARMKGEDWNTIKPSIKALVGKINSDPWGDYGRGEWFFSPIQTSTDDFGRTYRITLQFLQKVGGWYPLIIYRDLTGRVPKNVGTESRLRDFGLPAVGDVSRNNGIAIGSIYMEADFNPVFAFTPNDG